RRGGLPDFSRTVVAARYDFLPVRGKSDGENGAVVPLKREQLPASGSIPQTRCSIPTAGEDPPVVRGKDNPHDFGAMSLKGELKFARIRIPDLARKIIPVRNNPFAVGRKGHAIDLTLTSFETQ